MRDLSYYADELNDAEIDAYEYFRGSVVDLNYLIDELPLSALGNVGIMEHLRTVIDNACDEVSKFLKEESDDL